MHVSCIFSSSLFIFISEIPVGINKDGCSRCFGFSQQCGRQGRGRRWASSCVLEPRLGAAEYARLTSRLLWTLRPQRQKLHWSPSEQQSQHQEQPRPSFLAFCKIRVPLPIFLCSVCIEFYISSTSIFFSQCIFYKVSTFWILFFYFIFFRSAVIANKYIVWWQARVGYFS